MRPLDTYPISFPYGATSAPYTPAHPHRGNDRAAPVNTPINIGGVTIGYVGMTGKANGYHCHTQACSAGKNWADWFNPTPYEFKTGTVVRVEQNNGDFGNFVMVRVGNVDLTYAHMIKTNASVGQIIGGNVDMPISTDALYMLIRSMMQREPTQAEASNSDFLKDPDMAIKTFWNNGGKDNYTGRFNEGDRSNINVYLYGADAGKFRDMVGKPWKTALYNLFEGSEFKVDQLINDGDIANLKNILGKDPGKVKDKTWKQFVYQDLPNLLPSSTDAEKILQQIKQLIG